MYHTLTAILGLKGLCQLLGKHACEKPAGIEGKMGINSKATLGKTPTCAYRQTELGDPF